MTPRGAGDGGGRGEFWEPWQPEVGQRVRVRLNGECAFWSHHTEASQRPRMYEDGATATVTRIVPLDRNHGHGYEVDFDKPWPHPPGKEFPKIVGSVYAAIELEPVE